MGVHELDFKASSWQCDHSDHVTLVRTSTTGYVDTKTTDIQLLLRCD